MAYLREARSASISPSALQRAIDAGRVDPVMLELYARLLGASDATLCQPRQPTKASGAIGAARRLLGLGKGRQRDLDIDPVIAYAQHSLRVIVNETAAGISRGMNKTDRFRIWRAA